MRCICSKQSKCALGDEASSGVADQNHLCSGSFSQTSYCRGQLIPYRRSHLNVISQLIKSVSSLVIESTDDEIVVALQPLGDSEGATAIRRTALRLAPSVRPLAY